ncbi:hypothetical protein Bpfe_028551 [Biomphalaria pfeifferi]|uniref:Ig-like domain-containing protein n=1 Tax=Biomphalaria pfeifferi TaxID=112525 RepID=A0AAD8ATD1_BIOPF|nr:hypothetical protein Bpfe_028551 [Biomphalaria pfeifferi]
MKSSSKPSNWTTPVRFHAQTLINFTISSHEDIIQVELGDNVTFACSTDGYPQTDRYIGHEPFYSDFIYKRDLLDKKLNYTITDCQQAGKYTCRSYGRIAAWDYIDKAVYVEIPCPLGYFYKASNETNRQYIGNYHDTIKLSIPVLGSPAPKKMRLSRRNSIKQTVSDDLFSNEVSLVYKKEIGPFGSINVEFLDLQLISKSTYCILSVDNGVGEQSLFEFSIQCLNTSGLSTPGLSTPGLSTPGLSTPGLSTPGLSTPGLSTPGLSTPGLSTPGLIPQGLSAPGLIPQGLSTPRSNSPRFEYPRFNSPSHRLKVLISC